MNRDLTPVTDRSVTFAAPGVMGSDAAKPGVIDAESGAAQSFNVAALLSALWRSAHLIIGAALAAAVLAGAALINVGAVYTATAQIQLLRAGGNIIDIADVAENRPLFDADVISEMAVLSSPRVLRRVAERLELGRFHEFEPSEGMVTTVMRPVRRALSGAGPDKPDEPGDPNMIAASMLSNMIAIRQMGLSSLLQVSVTSESPDRAALIANTLVNEYLSVQVEDKRASSVAATTWLSDRLSELLTQMDVAEVAVAAARARIAGTGMPSEDVITRQIADLSAQRDAARLGGAANAEAQVSEIDAKITALETALLEKNERTSALRGHERRLETLRQVYQAFLTRLTEARELSSFQQPNAQVVTPASAPSYPSAPKRAQLVLLVFVFTAAMASAIVLFIEQRRDGYRTARQVVQDTGLRSLASLPRRSAPARRVEIEEETSEIHRLYAALLLDQGDQFVASRGQGRIVVVASSAPEEGAGLLAALLAAHAASHGATALVCADPAEPAPTNAGGATILNIDDLAPDQAQPMTEAQRDTALAALRDPFSTVVVLAPPILASADAVLLARPADHLILAVRWTRTPKGALRTALDTLRALQVAVDGVVLTDVNQAIAVSYGYPGEAAVRRALARRWRSA